MTASRYHSGSTAAASWAVPAGALSRSRFMPLQEVVEVALGAHAPAQHEEMRRRARRVELDEVAPPVPQVARAGEQLVHLVGGARVHAERLEVELDPAALRVVRVEVDDGEDGVLRLARAPRVGDQLV